MADSFGDRLRAAAAAQKPKESFGDRLRAAAAARPKAADPEARFDSFMAATAPGAPVTSRPDAGAMGASRGGSADDMAPGPDRTHGDVLARIAMTDPASRMVSELIPGASNAVIERAAALAPHDPEAAEYLRTREQMVAGGSAEKALAQSPPRLGRTLWGPRFSGGGDVDVPGRGRVSRSEAESIASEGALRAAAEGAAAASEVGFPVMAPIAAGAMMAGSQIPGVSEVTALPGEAGAAVARGAFGAKPGGAGEAIGGLAGSMVPAFLPTLAAPRLGRATASGPTPLQNVLRLPVSEVPAGVRQVGLGRLLTDPALVYEGANIAAALPQQHVVEHGRRLAESMGASEAGAALAGEAIGVAPFLPAMATERMALGLGQRQGQVADAHALGRLMAHDAATRMEPEIARAARDADFAAAEAVRSDAERRAQIPGVLDAIVDAHDVRAAEELQSLAPAVRETAAEPALARARRDVEADRLRERQRADEDAEQRAEAERYVGETERSLLDVAIEKRQPTRPPVPERGLLDFAIERAESEGGKKAPPEPVAPRALPEAPASTAEAYNRAADRWEALSPAERKAIAESLPEYVPTPRGRRFDRFTTLQQEAIAEALGGEKAPPAADTAPPSSLVTDAPAPEGTPLIETTPPASTAPAAITPEGAPTVKPEGLKDPKPWFEEKLKTAWDKIDWSSPEAQDAQYEYGLLSQGKKRGIFKKGKGRGTTLGFGPAALAESIDWKSPQSQAAVRSIVGAGAGYLYHLAKEEAESNPEGVAARRLLRILAGAAAFAGVPGWKKGVGLAGKAAKWGVNKTLPEGFRAAAALELGNQYDRISPEVGGTGRTLRAEKLKGSIRSRMGAERLDRAREVLKKDPDRYFLLNEYLRDAYGSHEPFLRLVDTIHESDPKGAEDLLKLADEWRAAAVELGWASGSSPESMAEYPGGHLQRITEPQTQRKRGIMARFRERLPKVERRSAAEDAWLIETNLPPEEVRSILADLGLPDPTNQPHHYLKGDKNGTLIKWAPNDEGELAYGLFREALGRRAAEESEVPVTPGRLRNTGDPNMTVHVGEGAEGGIGHLAKKADDLTLRNVRLSRTELNEAIEALKIARPDISGGSQNLTLKFDSPEARASFLDSLEQVAVGRTTHDVTPQFRAQLGQFLKEATIRTGEGSRGGPGKFIIRESAPRSRESLMGDVQDPVVRAYVHLKKRFDRIAALNYYRTLSNLSDAYGRIAIDVPDGSTVTHPGGVVEVAEGKIDPKRIVVHEGREYVTMPKDAAYGDLAGKAVRKDVYNLLAEMKSNEARASQYYRGLIGRLKELYLSNPAWLGMNVAGNGVFHYWSRTSPWSHPLHFLRVGADFVNAIRKNDVTALADYMEKVGFEFRDEPPVRWKEDAEAIEAIMRGAQGVEGLTGAEKGTLTMDILSGGTLASSGAKGLGIATAAGAGLGGIGSAITGLANGEEWDEILKRTGKGAGIGAGIGLTGSALARSSRFLGRYVDFYSRAVAHEIMTKEQGYSDAEARQRVRDFFQNYEEQPRIMQRLSGKTGGPLSSVFLNPFLPFYSELLRISKNAAAENPVRMAAGVMAIPIVSSVLAYLNGTFKDAEEKRAAMEAYPTGIFGRTEKGNLATANIARVNAPSEVASDLGDVTKDPKDKEAIRKLLTTVAVQTPFVSMLIDPFRAMLTTGARDLRYNQPLKRDEESGVEAGARLFTQAASNPLGIFGRGTRRIREAVEKPYQRGVNPKPSSPLGAIGTTLTGIRVEPVDFAKGARYIRQDAARDIREAKDDLRGALRQKNVRVDPEERARQIKRFRDAIKEAQERRKRQLKEETPQPVGGGR